ncbi:MAG: hypothetical protein QM802_04405 [Agriterribacter sp.]
MSKVSRHPSSFRDPSGFIFNYNRIVYRQVNQSYAGNYKLMKSSGLYERLVQGGMLIPHTEMSENLTQSADWYITLLPEQVRFISFPYEWSFDQLKDAALLTLDVVGEAVNRGMILKDATPFNIQFVNGRPLLIDTLSFELYDETKPWVAYRQFIESFISPLLLASYKSIELIRLLQVYLNGIPLSLTTKILPFKSRLRLHVFLHIFLQQALSAKQNTTPRTSPSFSKQKLVNVVDSLRALIKPLQLKTVRTEWNQYYESAMPDKFYLQNKKELAEEWLSEITGDTLLDIGANTGAFSVAASRYFAYVIAVDADAACVNSFYLDCKMQAYHTILPLCIDITNPSPAVGWGNEERSSFLNRYKAEAVLALAVIHHLVIGKNIRLDDIAKLLSILAEKNLIIEFVPKTDPRVQRMLIARTDIFDQYNAIEFERSFDAYFSVVRKKEVGNSGRYIYLMKNRVNASS